MKILIIKISSMGDIIHTLPAVTDAFHIMSDISFDWIVEKSFSEIPKWHPAIHRVIPINLRGWKKNWYKAISWREFYQYISWIKKQDYDLVIDAQGLLKTSLFITAVTVSYWKHGMDFISAREPASAYFLHQRHYINKYQHAICRIRQLFAYSLQYSVPHSKGEYNISYLFPRQVNHVAPYLIFFYCTTQLEKYWVDLNWDVLIRYAIDVGYNIKLPCWKHQDMLRVQWLLKKYDRVFMLWDLTLQQIAIQISQATAVISVDTGLSHLTAALGCPNLTLYGPTNPWLVGTYGMHQSILYSQTRKMEHLTALNVWNVFKKIL